jgi:peptidoglycan/xylan/chitin deacetylase (PgdA/CDA1 family)
VTFRILLYHGIHSGDHPYRYRSVDELEWVVSRETLRQHMEILADNGFHAVTLNDLLSSRRGGTIWKKPIIVTFDDGHETNFSNALPILNRFNFKAEFFVTTDWIDSKNYMNRAQLLELSRAGMSVQSHGRSHRFLTTLTDGELHDELCCSREKLGEIVGRDIQYISYPGGRYDSRVDRCVREAGYTGSLTSVRGNNLGLSTLFGLKREALTRGLTQRRFKAFLKGDRPYSVTTTVRRLFAGLTVALHLKDRTDDEDNHG